MTSSSLYLIADGVPVQKVGCCYSELTGSKNENIQVILSEIQEIDQNVRQVPQDLPQSFCFHDVRRHDCIKSVKSKTGKIIIKLYISENLLKK